MILLWCQIYFINRWLINAILRVLFSHLIYSDQTYSTSNWERKRTYLLQVKLAPVHIPFHLAGGGLSPLSLKLADSGQIPIEERNLKPQFRASSWLTCIRNWWEFWVFNTMTCVQKTDNDTSFLRRWKFAFGETHKVPWPCSVNL